MNSGVCEKAPKPPKQHLPPPPTGIPLQRSWHTPCNRTPLLKPREVGSGPELPPPPSTRGVSLGSPTLLSAQPSWLLLGPPWPVLGWRGMVARCLQMGSEAARQLRLPVWHVQKVSLRVQGQGPTLGLLIGKFEVFL